MGSILFSLLLFFNFTYLFIYLFIYSPIIVKINIVHLVFVGIHEEEISASSAEPFRGDYPCLLLNYE